MVDVADKKRIICDFLQRCNAYSDQMLADYKQQMTETDSHQVLELMEKLKQWQTYKVFNEHAISELNSDRLDAWF